MELKNEYRKKDSDAFIDWTRQRHGDKPTLNVELSFARHIVCDGRMVLIDADEVARVARLFKNKINQKCFGNAYRRGRKKELVIHLEHETDTHHHLHGTVEIPDHMTEFQITQFISDFRAKNIWLRNYYCEGVKTLEGSRRYNTKRRGADSVVSF